MRGAVAIRTNLRFGSVSDNSRDVGQYFKNPIVVSSYTVDRKLVVVPHHAYIGLLFYRTDLLQRYGYRRPPKTWNELESMANRIQTGERARGVKDFWGYVWQGAATEDLTCNGLEWQTANDGGRIIEDDQTISVNNPQTIKAWQRAAHWVGFHNCLGIRWNSLKS